MIVREFGEPLDAEDYATTLRRGVADVVRRQAEIGIDVVDDGEYGKVGWLPYVTERLNGVEPLPDGEGARIGLPDHDRFPGFYRIYTQYETIQWLPEAPSKQRYADLTRGKLRGITSFGCTGPITYRPEAIQRDIENLAAALADVSVEDAFLPVAAPASVELIQNRHYSSQEEFLYAVADALRTEYRAIVDAGFILQVDDAILPMQYFLAFRDRPLAEYRSWAASRIEALNHALTGIPPERVRYHVCFGSQNVPHVSDPGLRDIIDLVLRVNAGAYSIEASNVRHEHEWRIWEDIKLPDGKILIPGVVSHSTNVVEHPELVALRLTNFARLVGRENVMAGTDCGFSQFWNLVRVHEEVQWAKLEALVAGARLASAECWPRASSSEAGSRRD
jgi:5-methyltetrahydropteroyltriglutamate--homocysteine methyltransferase